MRARVIGVKNGWFVVQVDKVVRLGTKVSKGGLVVGIVEDIFGPTKKPYLKIKKVGVVEKGDEVVIDEKVS